MPGQLWTGETWFKVNKIQPTTIKGTTKRKSTKSTQADNEITALQSTTPMKPLYRHTNTHAMPTTTGAPRPSKKGHNDELWVREGQQRKRASIKSRIEVCEQLYAPQQTDGGLDVNKPIQERKTQDIFVNPHNLTEDA